MNKKIVFLVGNGFNYFISNYLNDKRYEKEIMAKLYSTKLEQDKKMLFKDLQHVLQDYCHLLDGIELSKNYDKKGEFLLQKISDFCEVIDDDMSLSFIEAAVCERIRKNMTESEEGTEIPNIPVTARTIFKVKSSKTTYDHFSTVLCEMLNKDGNALIDVFTTNYDGIVKEVFMKGKKNAEQNGMNYFALHGEYAKENIICTAPILKKQRVGENLSILIESLKNSNIIVLFGLGLTSDPHILAELNMVKNKRIIIFEASREQYLISNLRNSEGNGIGFEFLINNEIYLTNTVEHLIEGDKLILPVTTPDKILSKLDELIYKNDEIDN